MDGYGGQQYGDGSWADADYWGTTNALYIESCTFNGPPGQHVGMLDGVCGQRVVVRFCNSTNCPIGSHGTDNGGRIRSVRSYEVYGNNFQYQTTGGAVWNQCVYLRGGTGLIWSNTIWGGYSYIAGLADYRLIPVTWAPFSNVTGANPWDSNNPTLFDSGNASTTGSSSLVDSTKNWTPNQWVSSLFPYILYDVTQGIGALITGNTANTISVSGSFGCYPGNNPSGAMVISRGDTYQIRQLYASLDQCGMGQGDLLANAMPIDTVTGTAGWPNEVPDPVYVWGNNFAFTVPGFPSGLVGGANSFNSVIGTPKPGYIPLPFPHPLVSGIPAPGGDGGTPPAYYPLSVSGGSGTGTYPAGSVVAIAAAVPNGQVFSGWSGATNLLATPASSTTTLTMPSSAAALSANFVTLATNSSSVGGLIDEWTLAGNVNDPVGGNNGVVSGSASYVPGPTGAASSAISLDGSSQDIVTTTLGNFGANCASGFTLTAWVQSSYTGNYEAVFGSQGSSGMAVSICLNFAGGLGAGLIEGLVRDNAGNMHTCDVTSNSGITDGNWHFLAWVDNPGANSGTIYLDGVALNTATPLSAASATVNLSNPMGLGVRAGNNDGLFNGALADCRVYNQMLSASQVSALYASGAATTITSSPIVPPSNLQAHPPTGAGQ
jgi:hypothetical protein